MKRQDQKFRCTIPINQKLHGQNPDQLPVVLENFEYPKQDQSKVPDIRDFSAWLCHERKSGASWRSSHETIRRDEIYKIS